MGDDYNNDGFSPVASLANMVGASEPAIRLLLTILLGYPIAAIYRLTISTYPSKILHHLYFALSGFILCVFNYDYLAYHSFLAITMTYIFAHIFQTSPKRLIVINFIFHMGYLSIGYYYTESNEYDINWTMPHCVLVLRMIGFGFDIADGRVPEEQRSKDQTENCLEELPNFLKLCAFAYFPCSFIVGPQFPYRRYKNFIDGEYKTQSRAIRTGIERMLLGVLYLMIRQIGASIITDDYMLSDDYRNESFGMRLIYLGLWGKLALYKYISCWLLAEGAIICIGLSHKCGDDWSACSNVNLYLFETGSTMEDYVRSFNVNTNHWVAMYVYKRLKFLNNRTISYSAALMFLAVWHGFHSGYYMAFLMEYMIVSTERQISLAYEKTIVANYGHIVNNSLIYKLIKMIVLKSYNIIYMGWCMTPFSMLSFSRWNRVFASVRYFGFVYLGVWFIILQAYQHVRRRAEKSRQEMVFSQSTTLSAMAIDDGDDFEKKRN